jgi:16S rRNA (guanine(527)-N(7))-methyltransferase RsmG
MGSRLPSIPCQQFCDQLLDAVRKQLVCHNSLSLSSSFPPYLKPDSGFEERCFEHYLELQRWNPRVSLIGPGTAAEVIQRHYAESVAALPLIETVVDERSGQEAGVSVETLLDLGSGGGFPGLILAAARSRFQVFLLEPREKKWNFLRTAVRRCGLSCHCLDGRIGDRKDDSVLPSGLPERVDVVTCRALALSTYQFELIQEYFPGVRFFLWQGEESPSLPQSLQICREVPLVGSQRRRILEIVPV